MSVAVAVAPNPEMTQKATRRRFTTAYKRAIVAEAAACTRPGEVGALLRREGLYESSLGKFRRLSRAGMLEPGATRTPEICNGAVRDATVSQHADTERENRQLRRKLARALRIIEIQKKAAVLLGETLQDMNLEGLD
jgi:transposase-like protein